MIFYLKVKRLSSEYLNMAVKFTPELSNMAKLHLKRLNQVETLIIIWENGHLLPTKKIPRFYLILNLCPALMTDVSLILLS